MQNKIRTFAAIGMVALLSACGVNPSHTAIVTIDKPVTDPGLPRPVVLAPVDFNVSSTADKANFCVDERNYTNLIGNVTELKRYIEQLKETVKYYKNMSTTK